MGVGQIILIACLAVGALLAVLMLAAIIGSTKLRRQEETKEAQKAESFSKEEVRHFSQQVDSLLAEHSRPLLTDSLDENGVRLAMVRGRTGMLRNTERNVSFVLSFCSYQDSVSVEYREYDVQAHGPAPVLVETYS